MNAFVEIFAGRGDVLILVIVFGLGSMVILAEIFHKWGEIFYNRFIRKAENEEKDTNRNTDIQRSA